MARLKPIIYVLLIFAVIGASSAALWVASDEGLAQEPTVSNIDNILTRATGLFGGIDVNNRQNLFHIEPTVPLNALRNDWEGNVEWTGSTYQLNGTGFIDTSQRGEYMPGATAEVGQLVMFNTLPDSGSEDVKWMYFNGADGFYFGRNATCTYVGLKKGGNVLSSVCQKNWNVDVVDGSGNKDNPSGRKLSLYDANMYQTQFSWYGGGLIEMGLIFDDETGQVYRPVHRFDIKNQTSLEQVSLPIALNISNDPDNDVSVEIGGRQYSIIDNYEKTARTTKEIRESLTASATSYTPAVSFKIRDGFKNINLDLLSFSATPSCDVNAQVRFDTNLTNADFSPPSLVYNENHSLLMTDVNATSWQNPDGDPSGYFLDIGQLTGGQNQNKPVASVQSERVASVIGAGDIVTLAFKADDTSCTVTDITIQAEEDY